ncbi:hypothetical protein QQF64_003554 [Cirrhinus molitorella]|uniref:Uncharacterized protein n=1 Tax=Cirrhinus molitorella TaxID=172907 RepID=A0ABR3MLM6_9TELE
MRPRERARKWQHVSVSVFGCLEQSEGFGCEVTGISVALAYSGSLRICLAVLQGERWRLQLSSHLVCPFVERLWRGCDLAWSILRSI